MGWGIRVLNVIGKMLASKDSKTRNSGKDQAKNIHEEIKRKLYKWLGNNGIYKAEETEAKCTPRGRL